MASAGALSLEKSSRLKLKKGSGAKQEKQIKQDSLDGELAKSLMGAPVGTAIVTHVVADAMLQLAPTATAIDTKAVPGASSGSCHAQPHLERTAAISVASKESTHETASIEAAAQTLLAVRHSGAAPPREEPTGAAPCGNAGDGRLQTAAAEGDAEPTAVHAPQVEERAHDQEMHQAGCSGSDGEGEQERPSRKRAKRQDDDYVLDSESASSDGDDDDEDFGADDSDSSGGRGRRKKGSARGKRGRGAKGGKQAATGKAAASGRSSAKSAPAAGARGARSAAAASGGRSSGRGRGAKSGRASGAAHSAAVEHESVASKATVQSAPARARPAAFSPLNPNTVVAPASALVGVVKGAAANASLPAAVVAEGKENGPLAAALAPSPVLARHAGGGAAAKTPMRPSSALQAGTPGSAGGSLRSAGGCVAGLPRMGYGRMGAALQPMSPGACTAAPSPRPFGSIAAGGLLLGGPAFRVPGLRRPTAAQRPPQ